MTPNYRRDESWMGRDLFRNRKPRVTFHSIINKLFTRSTRVEVKTWQHDETGRICQTVNRPSERWFEVKK